jgi:WD40 repeat protein
LWDAQNGELLQSLEGHQNAVTSLAFHPQGTWLASGSLDSTVILWELSP